MRKALAVVAAWCAWVLSHAAQDAEIANARNGIGIALYKSDGTTDAVRGVDFDEEFACHDPKAITRSTIWLKATTRVGFFHTEFNELTRTGGTYLVRVGANGADGVPNVFYTGATASASTDYITIAGHGRSNGQHIGLVSGTGFTGLTVGNLYYVINATADTFQVSTTVGGAAVDITADGSAGVFVHGDDGVIRYKVDYDLNDSRRFAQSTASVPAWPASLPGTSIAFASLTYPDGNPVLGAIGSNGQPITNKTLHYWRGILDEHGNETHTICLADDDECNPLLDSGDSNTGSDGRMIVFVVNPVTPCLTFRATGAGQFYTTPKKVYYTPVTHDQTTYIRPGAGAVTCTISDINGGVVSYSINGGATQSEGDSSVTISDSAFSDGTNTLEYWFGSGMHATRTVVKNPGFPSASETHGAIFAGGSSAWTALVSRLGGAPYATHYAAAKTDSNWHQQELWDSNGNLGRRWPWPGSGVSSGSGGVLANAFVAAVEGNSAYRSGAPGNKTYAQYARELLVQSLLHLDPVGAEQLWSSNAQVCAQRIGGGYNVCMLSFNQSIAYDLMIARYRSDQHANGITPIEDYMIRDALAGQAHIAGLWWGGFVPIDPGMWGYAQAVGAMMSALAMPSYSSSYYGTSGFDGTTTTYTWAPFQTTNYTWKALYFDVPTSIPGYPNLEYRMDWEMMESTNQDGLIGDVDTPYEQTCSQTTASASTDVVTISGTKYHRFQDGQTVTLDSGTPPAPLSVNGVYYVRDCTYDVSGRGLTFKVSTTFGGAAINLTTDASNVQWKGRAYIDGQTVSRYGQWTGNLSYSSFGLMGRVMGTWANARVLGGYTVSEYPHIFGPNGYFRKGVRGELIGGYNINLNGGSYATYENLMLANDRFPDIAAEAIPAVLAVSGREQTVLGDMRVFGLLFYDNTAGGDSGDTTAPTVQITSPTSGTYDAGTASTVTIGGTAADLVGISNVSWVNSLGGSGVATGTASWSASVPLSVGSNVITVTATDTSGNSSTDAITVTRSDPVPAPLPTVSAQSASVNALTVAP